MLMEQGRLKLCAPPQQCLAETAAEPGLKPLGLKLKERYKLQAETLRINALLKELGSGQKAPLPSENIKQS